MTPSAGTPVPAWEVDARGENPAGCIGRLLARFDQLRAGDGFVLVTVDEMTAVLRLLERERPGLFESVSLERTGSSQRVLIIRRQHGLGRRGLSYRAH